MDGIIGNTTRWRYQSVDSAISTAITPRLENIAEMVISTDQIDMNQGFGSSSMQITYVTRRGSNVFHGRVYEGYRADIFNAKNWGSTVKPKYHQHELGASVGGPIFKDKLFFFGSFSTLDIPGGSRTTRNFLADDAKRGVFTYANGAAERPGRELCQHPGHQPRLLLPDGGDDVRAVRHQLRCRGGLSHQLLAGQPVRDRLMDRCLVHERRGLLQLPRLYGLLPAINEHPQS